MWRDIWGHKKRMRSRVRVIKYRWKVASFEDLGREYNLETKYYIGSMEAIRFVGISEIQRMNR